MRRRIHPSGGPLYRRGRTKLRFLISSLRARSRKGESVPRGSGYPGVAPNPLHGRPASGSGPQGAPAAREPGVVCGRGRQSARPWRSRGPSGGGALTEGGPGEPDADRGPRTASAPAAGGRTPCPARGARGGARTQPRRTDGMIDDEGTHRLVASGGLGPVDEPRRRDRRAVRARQPHRQRRGRTLPQGAALESAPGRPVAAREP